MDSLLYYSEGYRLTAFIILQTRRRCPCCGGSVWGGATASADIPSVTADFLSFARSKGLYAGLNLEGSVVAVRDGLNVAYCSKEVRPTDIIVKNQCSNRGANELRQP